MGRFVVLGLIAALGGLSWLPGRRGGQRGGKVVSESRPVSGYDRVHVKGAGTLLISQGDEEGLTIEAEEHILPLITSEVRDGELTIGFERDGSPSVRATRPITYSLAAQELRAIRRSGAGDTRAARLTAARLAVAVEGAGNVTVEELTADDLRVEIAGAGSCDLAGEVARQEVAISGAGEYRAEGLASGDARIEINGAGRASVRVSRHLAVKIAGAGSVGYIGDPQVQRTIVGAGLVRRLSAVRRSEGQKVSRSIHRQPEDAAQLPGTTGPSTF